MSDGVSIERRIEEAFLAILAADTDTMAQKPDLRIYHDQESPREAFACVIHCDQLTDADLGGTGRGGYYTARLGVHCLGMVAENADGTRLDRLARAAHGALAAMTAAALTAQLTGVTIHGVTAAPPEEQYEGGTIARAAFVTLHFAA